jgi:anti-sigma regulatory factor (Ser/Thr protein kinase)
LESDFSGAGAASSAIKKALKQLNVDATKIKRVVVAVYEAEVNAIAHAYGGTIFVDIDNEKIVVSIADKGPGIPDIALAMQKGYSTASPKVREMGFGAGMGLPNIKNNVDKLDIQTQINVGTTITMAVNF